MKTFFENKPYRLRQESNADGTVHTIRITSVKAIPEDFALRIGDIAHNIRSTLDHLAYSLARSPDDHTAFPIWHDESRDGRGRLQHPSIAGGVPRAVKRLVRDSQPYYAPYLNGQNPDEHLFWLLRQLDNIDKHRVVVACSASQGSSYHGFIPQPAGDWELDPAWGKLEAGEPVATFSFAEPNPKIKIDYGPILVLGVEGVSPALEGEDLLVFLWQAYKAVRDTVQKFEPYLRR